MMPSKTLYGFLLLLAPQVVLGYIYRAVPMFEKHGQMHCSDISIGEADCVFTENTMGKICKTMHIGKYALNPYVQKCGIGTTKCGPEHDQSLGNCAKFTGCYTVSNTTRACACMAGFFGNPYVKCFKHCDTDYDCPSPYAECRKDGDEKFKRCKCKENCPGDGVICKPTDICEQAKEGTDEHRRCLQLSLNDKTYVCDEGYYLDTDSKCAKIVPLTGEKVMTIIASAFADGSRIDVGKCFSMEINNDKGESHFYQLNSGDAVIVKKKLVTKPQLYLSYEVKTNDVIVFGLLEEDKSKLTKLFTVSNGLGDCQIDGVTKYGPTGTKEATSNVKVEVADIPTSGVKREEL